MRDAPMDGLIRKSLSAGVRKTPDYCVDENRMAAYLEASLSPQETTALEAHLAECAVCQEVLAAAMKLQPHPDDGLPSEVFPEKKTLFRFSIPIPALGALLVCIVIVAVFFQYQDKPPQIAVKSQVAELRAPGQQPAAQPSKLSEKPSPDISIPPPQISATQSGSADAAGLEKKGRVEGTGDTAAARWGKTAGTAPARMPPAVPVPAPEAVLVGGLESERNKEGTAVISTFANEQNAAVASSEQKAKTGTGAGHSPAQNDRLAAAGPSEALAVVPASVPVPPGSDISDALSAADAGTGSRQNKDTAAVVPTEGDSMASIRTQQPVSRPRIFAAQNRIATSLYTTSSVESTLRFAIKNLDSNLKSAESKQSADKSFYRHLGYWIDQECIKHQESEVVELAPEAPEFTEILAQHPDLKGMFPAIVYWEGRTCVLRQ